jgi:predicted GNAT superfamily acetyltransferase
LSRIELRDIEDFADIRACITLQRETWGMEDVDITPSRLFVVARHAGTPPIGAYDETGRLVGFVHTLPARHEGRQAYYSHMLAVAEAWRDKGVGHKLKLAQRERALRDNVDVVMWTFDPLQSRNAHFNLNKLGAVVRRYVVNFYGEEHRTAFDAGIGSDRVFAEWWVRSPKVERALAGLAHEAGALAERVEIPADLNAIKRRDQGDALLWRLRVRARFQSLLSRGLVAMSLQHEQGSETSHYVFADVREVANAR